MKAKQKTTKKRYEGFTSEERAAMANRVQEMKVAAQKTDLEPDVLEKIDEMKESDRVMARKIHAIIKASVPAIESRLWYGMPAYAKGGKTVCFFQPAAKFKTRYATLGFNDPAHLDDGEIWPVAYAITKITPAVEARIAGLIKKAAS